MFSYQKRLLFPVYVEHPDENFALVLLEHCDGKDGEFIAFSRYLRQKQQMTNPYVKDLLGMIAAEELGHMEMIGVAIKKLGSPELPACRTDQKLCPGGHNGTETGILEILKTNEEAEERAKRNYQKALSLTKDDNLKRMIQFLINREDVHQRLLKKAGILIVQAASNEQFSTLIHEYKMSLRVMK